jgi:hypothetical protein
MGDREPWQTHVEQEAIDLHKGITRLGAFLVSPAYGSVDHAEAALLHEQYMAMTAYLRVLSSRMLHWARQAESKARWDRQGKQ